VQTFDELTNLIGSRFNGDRFNKLEGTAREMRETIMELASPAIRQAESQIAARVRANRLRAPDIVRPPEEERVVTDILVAREIARIDLGVDVIIAQRRP
jgi:hypothetical protein